MDVECLSSMFVWMSRASVIILGMYLGACGCFRTDVLRVSLCEGVYVCGGCLFEMCVFGGCVEWMCGCLGGLYMVVLWRGVRGCGRISVCIGYVQGMSVYSVLERGEGVWEYLCVCGVCAGGCVCVCTA